MHKNGIITMKIAILTFLISFCIHDSYAGDSSLNSIRPIDSLPTTTPPDNNAITARPEEAGMQAPTLSTARSAGGTASPDTLPTMPPHAKIVGSRHPLYRPKMMDVACKAAEAPGYSTKPG